MTLGLLHVSSSSRPCSGAEHLFSHALEYLVGHDCGLHGERVGLGTLLMARPMVLIGKK